MRKSTNVFLHFVFSTTMINSLHSFDGRERKTLFVLLGVVLFIVDLANIYRDVVRHVFQTTRSAESEDLM